MISRFDINIIKELGPTNIRCGHISAFIAET